MSCQFKGSGTQMVQGVRESLTAASRLLPSADCRLRPAPCALRPAARGRRGVLLLVVLSLLVLFVMIALTYVLVATRHLQANKSIARKDITGEPPRKLIDTALMDVVRGSSNQHSP